MDGRVELEKEGLAEVDRWRPVSEVLDQEFADVEYDSATNPPALRYKDGSPVGGMLRYQIWDMMREARQAGIRAEAQTQQEERERAGDDATPGVYMDRTLAALDLLRGARRTHKAFCRSRTGHVCMCGASQHNHLVATVIAILEGVPDDDDAA